MLFAAFCMFKRIRKRAAFLDMNWKFLLLAPIGKTRPRSTDEADGVWASSAPKCSARSQLGNFTPSAFEIVKGPFSQNYAFTTRQEKQRFHFRDIFLDAKIWSPTGRLLHELLMERIHGMPNIECFLFHCLHEIPKTSKMLLLICTCSEHLCSHPFSFPPACSPTGV